ncbi:MAG: hypothetical protein NUV49_04220 [Patescibacteria group bacterium]|nr:hypothetical protein [Patescibacteria group bacterium]
MAGKQETGTALKQRGESRKGDQEMEKQAYIARLREEIAAATSHTPENITGNIYAVLKELSAVGISVAWWDVEKIITLEDVF